MKILNAVRRFLDAAMYRKPLRVTDKQIFQDGCYAVCPRCRSTLPRDYMHYCDRCGQYLSWDRF